MINFDYCNQGRFVFGLDVEDKVGDYMKELGCKKALMIHYGTGLDFENKLIDRLVKSIEDAGLEYVDFTGITTADAEVADKAIDVVKETGCDFILAVGGGAVIDIAKYVSVGVYYDGNVWDDMFIARKPVPKKVMPIGAVSTIAASASENSPDAVMNKGELKGAITADQLRPALAIMDPAQLYTLPPKQTVAGAVDIIAHAHERYWGPVKDNYMTDLMNEACIKTIVKYTPIALEHPDDYTARGQMLCAALMAHNGVLECGRMADKAVHSIELQFGGKYHTIHGLGCGCVTLSWIKVVYKKDIEKSCTYFNRVWGIEMDLEDKDGMCRRGIEAMENWYKKVGCPTNLADFGVTEEDIPEFVKNTRRTPEGLCGSGSKLTDEELTKIFRLGLGLETEY